MSTKPRELDATQQILSRLGSLQHDVDSIKQTTAFTLRSEKTKHLESLRLIFKDSKRRVQVYLAINGARTVQQIGDHVGIPRQNVGTHIGILLEEELIELVDSGKGDIYAKTPIDRTIRISKFLTEEYGFTMDGIVAPTKAKSKSKSD